MTAEALDAAAGPARPCACTYQNAAWVAESLTYDLQRKLYGRVIPRGADDLPWPRCPVCRGTGVDRRP